MTQLSVGLVSSMLLLLKGMHQYQCNTVRQLLSVHVAYGVNNPGALDLALESGWVKKKDAEIRLSKEGLKLLDQFDGYTVTSELWREIIREYIINRRPIWANRIPSGRKEAFIFMSKDEQRCFVEAGLMDTPDLNSMCWWDSIAEAVRSTKNLSLNETGRMGEIITIQYEKERTGIDPIWQSFETNLVGYDIISQVSIVDTSQLLIEVKTSSKNIEDATMFLTRHEWEVAMFSSGYSIYHFYLWLVGTDNRLAIVSADEMSYHVPTDSGNGLWKEIEIPFKTFKDKFTITKIN